MSTIKIYCSKCSEVTESEKISQSCAVCKKCDFKRVVRARNKGGQKTAAEILMATKNQDLPGQMKLF